MNIEQYTTPEDLKQRIYDMPLDSKLFVDGVPNQVYHNAPGYSSSEGKIAYLSENRLDVYSKKKREDKAHYVFGEMVHDSVRLDAEGIDELYCSNVELYGGGTNSTKALKICLAEGITDITQTEHAINFDKYPDSQKKLDDIGGRVLASKTQILESRILADLLRSSYHVAEALKKYKPIFELSVWRKDKDGFVRKCRPDMFIRETGELFDWKSIRELVWKSDISDRYTFMKWQIKNALSSFDYLFSAAWYMDVLDLIEDGSFMFVFADKDALEIYPPYLCGENELYEHRGRCLEAIAAIKSMKSKFVGGELVEPLTTFLPNDDYIFRGDEGDNVL